MEPADLPAAATARIAAWLEDERVDASYTAFVVRHLDVADGAWRWCCGSACDPCVERLARVVDRARQELCRPGAQGLPAPDGPA